MMILWPVDLQEHLRNYDSTITYNVAKIGASIYKSRCFSCSPPPKHSHETPSFSIFIFPSSTQLLDNAFGRSLHSRCHWHCICLAGPRSMGTLYLSRRHGVLQRPSYCKCWTTWFLVRILAQMLHIRTNASGLLGSKSPSNSNGAVTLRSNGSVPFLGKLTVNGLPASATLTWKTSRLVFESHTLISIQFAHDPLQSRWEPPDPTASAT